MRSQKRPSLRQPDKGSRALAHDVKKLMSEINVSPGVHHGLRDTSNRGAEPSRVSRSWAMPGSPPLSRVPPPSGCADTCHSTSAPTPAANSSTRRTSTPERSPPSTAVHGFSCDMPTRRVPPEARPSVPSGSTGDTGAARHRHHDGDHDSEDSGGEDHHQGSGRHVSVRVRPDQQLPRRLTQALAQRPASARSAAPRLPWTARAEPALSGLLDPDPEVRV